MWRPRRRRRSCRRATTAPSSRRSSRCWPTRTAGSRWAGGVGRVAVLAGRMPGRKGIWATLLGTVFAHRMFDLIPATLLVVWVLAFAELPHWAVWTVAVVLGGGAALFVAAIFGARVRSHS